MKTQELDGKQKEEDVQDQQPVAANALEALKSIRQSRGLALEEVAIRLKFTSRQIDAFENGRWEELPDGIGVRTLARNYSRMLGVEMASIEPLLPQHEVRGGITVATHHAAGRDLAVAMEPEETTRSWPWLLVILLVVLVVGIIAIWQGVLPQEMLPDWLRGLFE